MWQISLSVLLPPLLCQWFWLYKHTVTFKSMIAYVYVHHLVSRCARRTRCTYIYAQKRTIKLASVHQKIMSKKLILKIIIMMKPPDYMTIHLCVCLMMKTSALSVNNYHTMWQHYWMNFVWWQLTLVLLEFSVYIKYILAQWTHLTYSLFKTTPFLQCCL